MEMRLTVHVPRRRPHPVDVVVRWSGHHTAAQLCAALAEYLGEPVGRLSTRGREVAADAVVGEPPLLHGAELTVDAFRHPGAAPAGFATTLLQLAVVGGPDAGHARSVSPPGLQVGRAPASGLVVADEALSRVHAVLRVDERGVLVEDQDSTNGVLVDGVPVRGPTPVDTSSAIGMGASTLRLRRAPGRGGPVVARGDGRLLVPSTGPSPSTTDTVEVACPEPPPERHRARIPWVAALVPLPVGLGLAYFLGPQLLAFALLGPVMVLAGAVSDRWGTGRARRRDAVGHAEAVRRAGERLEQALAEEGARLDRDHPDPHAVLVMAERRSSRLWGGAADIPLRIGSGRARTAVTWVEGGARTRPRRPRTPVVVALVEVGCMGVLGPRDVTDAVLRALVGQLCATQPPDRLALHVAARPGDEGWAWSGLLPHHVALHEPGEPEERLGAPALHAAAHRVLVVPDGSDATTAAYLRNARAAGWLAVVAAQTRGSLPADCGAVATADPGGGSLETTSDRVPARTELVVDGVGLWWVERVARALAPLTPGRPTHRATGRAPGIPDEVVLDDVLDPGALEPDAVAAVWQSARDEGGLAPAAAVVGTGRDGPLHVDLVRDGPHVLVGGTTGSGKSEFLRTLVAGLALSSSPRDLNLVLVDFKGGAAFGACAGVPHVVGLVTDLDDHLASRALVSLRAELRRRELLLVDQGVQDVDDYARTPGARSHPLPRLVVVVDELRTLVDEVPEFVSGLVRLAAQGRSLGVHLVLATQRPAGAVTAEVQANVSLRVAFRVRDRTESVAIVEDGAAADIHPSTPGRAVLRGADGVLQTFQAAILATSTPPERHDELVVVAPGGPGGPESPSPAPTTEAERRQRARRTEQLVAALAAAHVLTGDSDPRRPWAPTIPDLVRLDDIEPLLGGGPRAPGAVVGVVDEPDLQRMAALLWRPVDGTWLIAGRPRSGRTTALRAIVTAAAAEQDSRSLHVHLVDPGGGLCELGALPHVGTRVVGNDRRALAALTDHLQGLVAGRRRRRASATPSSDAVEPTVLVVVDGWEQLLEAHTDAPGGAVVDDLVRVLRDGAAVGVVGAVAGGRSLLQPRWAALAGSTIALGRLDPLDVALAGLRSSDVPVDPPPGRGIRLRDRREVHLAFVTAEDASGEARREGACGTGPPPGTPCDPAPAQDPPGGRPWRFRPLPTRVPMPTPALPQTSGRGAGGGGAASDPYQPRMPASYPVGVFGQALEVFRWEPSSHGRVLLVAGPARSGRSTALRVLAASVAAHGRSVLLVSRAATPGALGVAASGHAHHPRSGGSVGTGGVAAGRWMTAGAGDVDAVVRARRANPRLAVVVDDGDLLDDAPVTPVLHEVLELVDRDDGLVVVTATSAQLATRFRGLDAAVARHGTGLLLQPRPGDGDALGARSLPAVPHLPGRGVFVSGGSATEVQVFIPSDGQCSAQSSPSGAANAS